jgi:hypothetical protein
MSHFPRQEAMLLRPVEVNDREQRTHLAVKELQDYFKDHWFSNEWSCHWQHHLVRGEESLDLNYSTNNIIESTWRLVSECIAPHGCAVENEQRGNSQIHVHQVLSPLLVEDATPHWRGIVLYDSSAL